MAGSYHPAGDWGSPPAETRQGQSALLSASSNSHSVSQQPLLSGSPHFPILVCPNRFLSDLRFLRGPQDREFLGLRPGLPSRREGIRVRCAPSLPGCPRGRVHAAQSQLCLGLSVPGALLTGLGPRGPGWVSSPSGSAHCFAGPLAHCTHCRGLTTLWARRTLGLIISFHPTQPPKVGTEQMASMHTKDSEAQRKKFLARGEPGLSELPAKPWL